MLGLSGLLGCFKGLVRGRGEFRVGLGRGEGQLRVFEGGGEPWEGAREVADVLVSDLEQRHWQHGWGHAAGPFVISRLGPLLLLRVAFVARVLLLPWFEGRCFSSYICFCSGVIFPLVFGVVSRVVFRMFFRLALHFSVRLDVRRGFGLGRLLGQHQEVLHLVDLGVQDVDDVGLHAAAHPHRGQPLHQIAQPLHKHDSAWREGVPFGVFGFRRVFGVSSLTRISLLL
jgi:hypothetical protein